MVFDAGHAAAGMHHMAHFIPNHAAHAAEPCTVKPGKEAWDKFCKTTNRNECLGHNSYCDWNDSNSDRPCVIRSGQEAYWEFCETRDESTCRMYNGYCEWTGGHAAAGVRHTPHFIPSHAAHAAEPCTVKPGKEAWGKFCKTTERTKCLTFNAYCDWIDSNSDSGTPITRPTTPPTSRPTNPPTTRPKTTATTEQPTTSDGNDNKNPFQKYSCDANGLANLYSRLPVPSRDEVVAMNPGLAPWSAGKQPNHAEENMRLYSGWLDELDYDCNGSRAKARHPAGLGWTCNLEGKLHVKDAYCCSKAIHDRLNQLLDIRDHSASQGACVPDSIVEGGAANSENVKRVERIMKTISREIPSNITTNIEWSIGDFTPPSGLTYGWLGIFPMHSFASQMRDKKGELPYSYDNFLRAVETFPAFCGKEPNESEAEAELVCRRTLATAFAHFIQETGAFSTPDLDVAVHQGLWHNAEDAYKDPSTHLFKYTSSTSHVYTNSSELWWNWYPEHPGRVYPGRGPKQLTYAYNYGMASDTLFGDRLVLLQEPDLASVGPIPFMASLWFFLAPQAPKPSMLDIIRGTGTANSSQHNFGATTFVINGELECPTSAQANRRLKYFNDLAEVFGITDDSYYRNTQTTGVCCNGCITAGAPTTPMYFDKVWGDVPKCQSVTYQTPFKISDTSGLGYKACLENFF